MPLAMDVRIPKKSLGRTIAGCLFLIVVGGCASAPPLDDISLVEAKLASPADLERYAQTRRTHDGFSYPLQFDDVTNRMGWPYVRLVVQSDHPLFKTDSVSYLGFYLCDANVRKERLWGFGGNIVWNGRAVTPGPSREVGESMRAAGQPQQYELFFDYVYYDKGHAVDEKRAATLLPLPEDLCISTVRYNYPFRTSVGRPMRIRKDTINRILGPLPRETVKQD